MKLEDILKSRGWTDADIAAAGPMLADARFRADMEASYGAVASERDELKGKDDAWQRQLDEQWQPRVTAAEKEAQAARLEAANLKEQLKIAKDYGYMTPEAEAAAEAKIAAATATANGYDPKNHPSWDDVKKFGEAQGDAIAIVNDLAAEYAYLNGGKSLYEYETTIDGRTLRGMQAIRAEAKVNRQGLEQYVSKKFDFEGKRTAMRAKAAQDHDDAIRRETVESTRAEMAAQYGNPMMRTAMPSRAPFIPAKPASGGKQPWELTQGERKAARVTRAMEIQTKTAAVN